MAQTHYIPADRFFALVERLAEHRLDIVTGEADRHAIIQALGEIGGIWPDSLDGRKKVIDSRNGHDYLVTVTLEI